MRIVITTKTGRQAFENVQACTIDLERVLIINEKGKSGVVATNKIIEFQMYAFPMDKIIEDTLEK